MNTRTLSIYFLIPLLFLFTGCNEQSGHLNLKTLDGIKIYIDNKLKGKAGEGITKLKLEEGKHIIKVSGDSADGDWHYEAERKVYIGADVEITLSLIPDMFPTAQRKEKERLERKRLEEEELAEKQRVEKARLEEVARLEKIRQKKLSEAQEYGCSKIDEFEQYKILNKKSKEYKTVLTHLYSLKKEVVKDTGYLDPNDYLELMGYSIQGKSLILNIKNKFNYPVNYFYGNIIFTDKHLNDIESSFIYADNIKMEPHQSKKIKVEVSEKILRKTSKFKKNYMFIKFQKINYTDNFGVIRKELKNTPYFLRKISDKNIFDIENKFRKVEKRLSKICQNK